MTFHQQNIHDLFVSLQDAAAKVFKRFSDNQMKRNISKCYLLMNKDKFSENHLR